MDIDIKNYRNLQILEHDLAQHLPEGIPSRAIIEFAAKNSIDCFETPSEYELSLSPLQVVDFRLKSVRCVDFPFDRVIVYDVKGVDKWYEMFDPRSWFSFVNNWYWVITFYIYEDALVHFEISNPSDGL